MVVLPEEGPYISLYINISGKYGSLLGGTTLWHHVSLHTYCGAICCKYGFGKYNIFLKPDETMLLLAWQKHVYTVKLFLLITIQGVYVIVFDVKQNEKHMST